ncbi:MAG: carbon storage regulator [Acidobacteria bacterium RIFCSPLOWO2_02_FULL_59_13]|nr:MAG: carbon storage regulator [Acidobacteria bacterium RIFCSPLOWO2_02_FULL_59_13]
MTPILATLCCFGLYWLAYRFYARHMARRVFALDPNRLTPAHELRDDQDYVPSNRFVLFGHHFASITGLSPMLGPAVAVIWGWLPAMLWVVLGAIFIGAVHDFGSLVVSIRARGMSIGKVAEDLIGHRAKSLFHIIIFFLIALAMGVFVHVVAVLFTPEFYPQSVLPSASLIFIAVIMGMMIYRRGWNIRSVTLIGFVLMLLFVWWGMERPILGPSLGQWKWMLLLYAFAASVLPVWMLLQPRDYINSLLLYLGLGGMYLGLFVSPPQFVAPALNTRPDGAPPIFPFVFIVIACGAVSGFHALVSSGTTAKQLNRETDASFIGYGGMIGESLLGLMSVLACTAGFSTSEDWFAHYSTWQTAEGLGSNISAFIGGSAHFLGGLGVPAQMGAAFVAVVVVSFALTTLDSATRLLRYNIAEIGETLRLPVLGNRYVASALAIAAIWFFAFYERAGQSAGLLLWQLFGTTNQLMAGLALLAITLYLLRAGKPVVYTLAPMLFMLATTLAAMGIKLVDFWQERNWTLLVTGAVIFSLAIWLGVEAALAALRYRAQPHPGVAGIHPVAGKPQIEMER